MIILSLSETPLNFTLPLLCFTQLNYTPSRHAKPSRNCTRLDLTKLRRNFTAHNEASPHHYATGRNVTSPDCAAPLQNIAKLYLSHTSQRLTLQHHYDTTHHLSSPHRRRAKPRGTMLDGTFTTRSRTPPRSTVAGPSLTIPNPADAQRHPAKPCVTGISYTVTKQRSTALDHTLPYRHKTPRSPAFRRLSKTSPYNGKPRRNFASPSCTPPLRGNALLYHSCTEFCCIVPCLYAGFSQGSRSIAASNVLLRRSHPWQDYIHATRVCKTWR